MNRNIEKYSYQLKKERRRKTWNLILFIIFLYIFINVIIRFFIFPVKQNSTSMVPDISENSVVMVSPFFSEYKRGDIVLLEPRYKMKAGVIKVFCDRFVRFFTAQQISLLEDNNVPSSKVHLRRVVGVPGDTIYMRDYVLYIKPANEHLFLTEFEIASEPYNVTFYVPPSDWDTEIGVKGAFSEITLGENEYFVLADNRKSSDDSRLWGPVTAEQIKAKVLLCYFPFKNFKLF